MELHYSVNGAPEKTVSLLPNRGMKAAEGRYMLALEDYKMQPGDIVSVYAVAKDARETSRSDVVFVDAQPYERNYTQSQAGGGGGGGGMGGGGMQDREEVVRRQKQIIASTHNIIGGGAKGKDATPENARYLSDTQRALQKQAESMAGRTTARE